MRIRLTGIKAVLALIMVAGVIGFRFVTAHRTLSDDAKNVLGLEIRSEYARGYLEGLNAENITPEKVDSITALARVTFPKISARGSLDNAIVRAEVLIDGAPPPDGRSVRYCRMQYSSVLGWRLKSGREPTALQYYLAIF